MTSSRAHSHRAPSTRRLRAALTAGVAGLTLAGAGFVVAPSSSATTGGSKASAYAHGAYEYAAAHGYSTGIAILDTKTGKFYGGGHYNTKYPTESVAKVFIATELLLHGRMHGTTAEVAYKMITQSDDASANRLYGLVGGDQLINRIKSHYHLPALGSPPIRAGWWGNTHITAKGLVTFYAKIRKDKKVWPWLYNAMYHAHKYGSDGTYQFFGLPSATKGFAVKQGWGDDDNCFCHAGFNTTGFLDHARYAVAILTLGPARSYGHAIASMVTAIARRTLPGGVVDDPATHNPHAWVSHVSAQGDTLHVAGWAIDPDHPGTRLKVTVYDGSKRLLTSTTDVDNAWVNHRFHGRGDHWYRITTPPVAGGRHTICVVAANLGEGTADPKRCAKPVTVNGAPRGKLTSATASSPSPGEVTLTGWADDRSAPSASSEVHVFDGTKFRGRFTANVPDAAVNKAEKLTGDHGFTIRLTGQQPGRHTYTITALNTGYPGPNVHIGQITVDVPGTTPPP